jgi:hypothetical protein
LTSRIRRKRKTSKLEQIRILSEVKSDEEANKGVRGMPRLSEATKDVISCEKLRGVQINVDPQMSEWGNLAG